jgi:hypothetical protein
MGRPAEHCNVCLFICVPVDSAGPEYGSQWYGSPPLISRSISVADLSVSIKTASYPA